MAHKNKFGLLTTGRQWCLGCCFAYMSKYSPGHTTIITGFIICCCRHFALYTATTCCANKWTLLKNNWNPLLQYCFQIFTSTRRQPGKMRKTSVDPPGHFPSFHFVRMQQSQLVPSLLRENLLKQKCVNQSIAGRQTVRV